MAAIFYALILSLRLLLFSKEGNFMCRYTSPWRKGLLFVCEGAAQKVGEVSTADFELSHSKNQSLQSAAVPR